MIGVQKVKLSLEFKVLVLFCALAVFVLLAGNHYIVYWHEQAHQKIYGGYFVDSNVEYGAFGLSGRTIMGDSGHLTDGERMTMRALHAANEAYGYQVFALLAIFFIFFFLQAMFFYLCFVVRGERWR